MTEQNKAVVRQLFDEVWNTGRLDKIEELYAPDFVVGLSALRSASCWPPGYS